MKKPFAVGDRVAVYLGGDKNVACQRITGILIKIMPSGYLQVDYGDQAWLCHPKQCRRLKPKRVAREFWIIPTAISSASLSHPVVLSFRPDNAGSYVHVIEKLPKKERNK